MPERKASGRWAFLSALDIGADGDPYLDRLRILQTPLGGIYLHHIHRPDREADPHDHPWAFISVVLAGAYTELVWPDKHKRSLRAELRHRPRWSIGRIGRQASHILTDCSGPLWTLVVTGPRRSDWGFWTVGERGLGEFVPWREYERVRRG